MAEACVYNEENINFNIEYNAEAMLIHAIINGQTTRAKAVFSNIPIHSFPYEENPLVNLKRYSHGINTLFSQVIKESGVCDIELNHLYAVFKVHIEHLSRTDDIFRLWTEMIEKYCTIVNRYNAKEYSPTIQRAIVKINYDISQDLTLKEIASYLNINPSYLSNLFRKETGNTLTCYVNKKKMEHAAFLLQNTNLHISIISQECGILDENYFARIFKKQYHVTPTQYRKQK